VVLTVVTGQLMDMLTRGLVSSWTGQVADWTDRGLVKSQNS